MRPKSEIYTPKGDDEHPHPFHMQSFPPPRACDVFHCVLVSPCLVSGFLALFHNHCYSLHKTKSGLVISIWLQGPGPVATKMPFFRRNSNSLRIFSAPAQDGKPLFPLWEITRHFAQSARRGEEKIQLPTLLGVVICARVGSLVGGVFPV